MRIKNFIRKNYKLVIGFIIGGIVFGGIGVYAVTTKDVTYDNRTSKLTSNTLQGAIDELNTKATTKIAEAKATCPEGKICKVAHTISPKNANIVKAYSYDQVNTATKCITGEESTCKETNCINYSNRDSCDPGTIIKYKVNTSTTKYFYVIHDDGETMTLQQRENIVYNTAWYSSLDNRKGPLTILPALESATSSWTNVNSQTYQMGTTNFNGTNAYTGCTIDGCTTNTYTLGSRTARARMITMQEAVSVGCREAFPSCPVWMYNYLNGSTSNKGTVDDKTGEKNDAYWTMSAYSSNTYDVWTVNFLGTVYYDYYRPSSTNVGARAVVVVNK